MDRFRGASVLAVLAWVLFEFSGAPWRLSVGPSLSWAMAWAVVATFGTEALRDAWKFRLRLWRHRWPDLLWAVPAALSLSAGSVRGAATVLTLRLVAREAIDFVSWRPVRPLLEALLRRPLTLLVLTFAFTISLGTVGLMIPAATTDARGAPLLTALFTATSATCVTGLSVVDTGSYFTRFGQWIILLLIQVGGLGLMTITTTLALAVRSRLSAAARGAMQEILEEETVQGFQRMLFSIVLLTITLEALGALALWPILTTDPTGQPLAPNDRAFFAAFHAVSAFCNAGFSLYADGMMRWVGHPGLNLTVIALVTFGGLGFPVLSSLLDLRHWWRWGLRRGWRQLSVHVKVVLLTSGLLLMAGAVLFIALEWNHSLRPLSWGQRLWASLFMSTSLRTAGFNTVDTSLLSTPMLLVCLVLMFIGGSPGGTAGGVKTTTVAVLTLTFLSLLRRRGEVEVLGRSLPATNVYRAVAVALISLGLLFALTFLLVAAEPHLPLQAVLFEAVSAFGTVGLSTGVTTETSTFGRLLLCLIMFIGRLGPFTLALAVGLSQSRAPYSYPSAKIVVG